MATISRTTHIMLGGGDEVSVYSAPDAQHVQLHVSDGYWDRYTVSLEVQHIPVIKELLALLEAKQAAKAVPAAEGGA